jgi:hypothetical protein
MPPSQPKTHSDLLYYRIRLEGQLDQCWSEWFDGMTISSNSDETIIAGLVVDQPALYGLLKRVRDLGLPLIGVERVREA